MVQVSLSGALLFGFGRLIRVRATDRVSDTCVACLHRYVVSGNMPYLMRGVALIAAKAPKAADANKSAPKAGGGAGGDKQTGGAPKATAPVAADDAANRPAR